ncbi:MAG TPA: BON domain-containing protein [Gemmatimonadota bacterium]|nr:BON domain-containing protein [Gemmatimonadota bacterium]
MKSDAQLQNEIQAEINADPKIAEPGRIGVGVRHGVVTLTGQVEAPSCKWQAERAAWRVNGVRAVAEEIEVKPAGAPPTDAEIADAVATLLEWSAELDAKDLHAKVEDGWVTLEGVVRDRAELSAAERLAAGVRGVGGVSNRIQIEEAPEERPIEARVIEEAADWHAVDQEC